MFRVIVLLCALVVLPNLTWTYSDLEQQQQQQQQVTTSGQLLTEEMLQAVFFNQLKTQVMLRNLSEDVSNTSSACSNIMQDLSDSFTQHLLDEVVLYKQKAQQERSACEQLLKRQEEECQQQMQQKQDASEQHDQLLKNITGMKDSVLTQMQEMSSSSQRLQEVAEELEQLQGEHGELQEEHQRVQGVVQQLEADKEGLQTTLQEYKQKYGCPKDCEATDPKESGVQLIFPNGCEEGIEAWCEVEDGRVWTMVVNRRRQDQQEKFSRTWQEYKQGFGNVTGEHWLGNEAFHGITTGYNEYVLKIEAKDFSGAVQQTAQWRQVTVGNEESGYQLEGQYLDGFFDVLRIEEGVKFSTVDRDNDRWPRNCAVDADSGPGVSGAGGWWYRICGFSYPTRPFPESETDATGMKMFKFTGRFAFTVLSEFKMMVGRRVQQ